MTKYIIFSESKIGIHSDVRISDSEFIVFPLVFVTVVALEKETLVIKTNLQNNKVFKEALSHYNKKDDVKFLIGYDLDENGEVMASVIKDTLIFFGVSDFEIFRTPLTEEGYLAVSQFGCIETYKKFLYHQQEIRKRLAEKKLPQMGVFKILSLQYLQRKQGRSFNIEETGIVNVKGSSTATAVYQYIKENNSADLARKDNRR